MSDATRLLNAATAGDRRAAADLLPLVYDELRKLATARMAAESPGQTLQPTALVHEAYLRLVGGFGGQARGGELPQLVVHERQQVGSSLAVATRGGIEEAGHIGHDRRVYQLFGGITTRKRGPSGTPATGQLPTAQRCLIPGRAKYN